MKLHRLSNRYACWKEGVPCLVYRKKMHVDNKKKQKLLMDSKSANEK